MSFWSTSGDTFKNVKLDSLLLKEKTGTDEVSSDPVNSDGTTGASGHLPPPPWLGPLDSDQLSLPLAKPSYFIVY